MISQQVVETVVHNSKKTRDLMVKDMHAVAAANNLMSQTAE